jgi:hypothetical protein
VTIGSIRLKAGDTVELTDKAKGLAKLPRAHPARTIGQAELHLPQVQAEPARRRSGDLGHPVGQARDSICMTVLASVRASR